MIWLANHNIIKTPNESTAIKRGTHTTFSTQLFIDAVNIADTLFTFFQLARLPTLFLDILEKVSKLKTSEHGNSLDDLPEYVICYKTRWRSVSVQCFI